jgi:hypothetical protein
MNGKTFLSLVVVILILGALILQGNGKLPFLDQWLESWNPFKPPKTTIYLGDAIITDIIRVSKLTTTIYSIQELMEKSGDGPNLNDYYKLAMIVKGTVEAGLDLSKLKASDVVLSADGKSITVNLPPVTILTSRDHIISTDPKETNVFDWYFVDFLYSGPKQNEVEAQLRAEAGSRILQIACAKDKDNINILDKANTDAKDFIERFMNSTRPDIKITVVSAPVPTTCP